MSNKRENKAKIERGPKRKRAGYYPLDSMRIGDSVRVRGEGRTAPYHLAWIANRRFPKKRFEGGYDTKGKPRVWRVK